jgi:hypothetical protein
MLNPVDLNIESVSRYTQPNVLFGLLEDNAENNGSENWIGSTKSFTYKS